MPFIIGGLMAATSIMGSMSGASQNKAQATAAKMQQEQQNFNGRWQNEAQNRNLLRQWEAQYHMNNRIEEAANKTKSSQKFYAAETYKNQSSALSKQTRQTTETFLGTVASRGISTDSASARAMLRQATEQSQINSQMLRTNYSNQQRDIETQYQNILSQRNLNNVEQQAFVEGRTTVVDSSSQMMMTGIATGLMSGAAAGIGAYGKTGLKGTVSGNMLGVT